MAKALVPFMRCRSHSRLRSDGSIRKELWSSILTFITATALRPFSAKDEAVFTLSIHQLNNYPAYKPPSNVDLDMSDGVGDKEYLDTLVPAVRDSIDSFQPEMIFYVGGADPYCEDQLGGLKLSMEGLQSRDARVFEEARKRQIPVVTVLAGGYARRVEGIPCKFTSIQYWPLAKSPGNILGRTISRNKKSSSPLGSTDNGFSSRLDPFRGLIELVIFGRAVQRSLNCVPQNLVDGIGIKPVRAETQSCRHVRESEWSGRNLRRSRSPDLSANRTVALGFSSAR